VIGRIRHLHRLPPLGHRHRLGDLPEVIGFARFHSRSRRGPSLVRILLAGLAVFALVRLMSATNRPKRSAATTLVLGLLLVIVGTMVMSFRRSARRYQW
jgi:hypothetical protein